MRWEQGRAVVDRLLETRELERVSPDRESAESLLEMARRHLDSARKIRKSDPEGAYAALYEGRAKRVGNAT